MPLSVAVGIVRDGEDLLLIRRARGAYAGWWALPGGKIEDEEHVAAAAEREIREEAGLDAAFRRHLGVVSEHLVEDGAVRAHFLLHVCLLAAETRAVTAGDEGELRWVKPGDLGTIDRLVPSDRAMVEHLLLDGQADYHECVLEEDDAGYHLRSFGRARPAT